MIQYFAFIFLVILFSSLNSYGQSITATVQPQTVRPGDRFVLSVTVSSEANVNVEQPELPNLSAFRLMNVFTSSETRSIFDGGRFQVTRAQTFNFELEAVQSGEFTITPINVLVNGDVRRAPDVQVTVSESASPPSGYQGGEEDDSFQQMDDMFQQLLQRRLEQLQQGRQQRGGARPGTGSVVSPADLKDAFYVEVEVDKTKVYVGEQVTVSWYLVTRAQVTDIDTLKYPSVAGFWREDLELATRLNFRPEIINGISYNRALLASFALFPLKAGSAKIDEYTARCTLVSMGAFGGVTGQQTVTKSSQVVPITVLPLPEESRPNTFSGAVGEFKVSARVDNTNVETGNPLTLKIRFEGRGNAKPIDIDKLTWPAGLEFYDKKSSTKYFTDGRSFKEFEVILVPRQEGEIKIPSLDFAFFDPNKKTYYQQSTAEIILNVKKGNNPSALTSQPLAQGPAVLAPSKPTLPPLSLQTREAFSIPMRTKIYAWGLVFLMGCFYLTYRGQKEFRSSEKKESLKKTIRSQLVVIQGRLSKGDSRSAAVEMINLVYLVLGELSGAGGASREMKSLLEKTPPSFRRDLGERLEKSIANLEVLAFAPSELAKKDSRDVFKDAEQLLKKSLDYNFDENEG